ncbi:MAG: hypothetical protein ABIJ82_01740 [Patescibacteria group bacterium]
MPSKTNIVRKLLTLSLFSIIGLFLSFNTFAADISAPITSASKDPSEPDGNNNWYVTPVEITLESTDLGSGVKEINYKIDSLAWQKVDFSNSLNLAPNPSFEFSDENPPINTKDWVVGTIDEFVNYTRDASEYKPGFETTSVKITSTGSSWHSINHADTFAVATPYSNMSAYAWIKTSDVAGSAYFKVYAVSQDAFGVKTVTPLATSSTLSGTNDWTQVSVNFVVSVPNAIGVYIEIGLDGTGTIWTDAVNISNSLSPSTTFTVSSDSELHTVLYYAVDRAENVEATKTLTFKLDQTPPGNWRNSGAVRALTGSDHELYVWTNIDDYTSGISTLTDKFQYTTDDTSGFGIYTNLLYCNTPWLSGHWAALISPPFLPGVHSAYLITPKVDFCNSNWKICKYVRFYAEDMAGNTAEKDMCINGPWIKVRGKGIVRSDSTIDMLSEAEDYNTDGLIETSGMYSSFFDSSTHYHAAEAPAPPDYDYDKFSAITTSSKTTISTSGNLVSSSGVYKIDGNYTVTSGKIPGNYGSATFNQIVFVNGNLRISNNIKVANGSTALFIVKGDVEISKNVGEISVGIISNGTISTAYNITEGEFCSTLVMKGIFIANKFLFTRTLQGTKNDKYPSEDITYEPKYAIKLVDYMGLNAIKWLSSD